jgi:ring-1,2-phenylacetyl-CoA epoxidase subunit PaaA
MCQTPSRWWWPSVMMFGPNDESSPHIAQHEVEDKKIYQ